MPDALFSSRPEGTPLSQPRVEHGEGNEPCATLGQKLNRAGQHLDESRNEHPGGVISNGRPVMGFFRKSVECRAGSTLQSPIRRSTIASRSRTSFGRSTEGMGSHSMNITPGIDEGGHSLP
jgi:hypothetical protein